MHLPVNLRSVQMHTFFLFIEQPCLVCGRGGRITCAACYHEKSFVNGIKKPFFCDTCSRKWHNHNRRKHHKLCAKDCQYFSTGILQLLSVICIETHHYVCFNRITGSGKDEWVFFDSMAERLCKYIPIYLCVLIFYVY